MKALDVLAVMDALNGNTASLKLDAEVRRARGAVAELIEADKEYDEAMRLANVGYGSADEDRAARQRLREAINHRAAALSRVTGVQA